MPLGCQNQQSAEVVHTLHDCTRMSIYLPIPEAVPGNPQIISTPLASRLILELAINTIPHYYHYCSYKTAPRSSCRSSGKTAP